MINDSDVCKHCNRIVGEVPKYHCPKSPTGMHEAVDPPTPTTNPEAQEEAWDRRWSPEATEPEPQATDTGRTIDITPVGCQTPEGVARVNAAKEAFENATAEVANAATQLLVDWRPTLLDGLNNPLITQEGRDALFEDLHQLDALIDTRRRKQEEFLRAVAGAPK
jgi:hypothetical protein